LHAETDACDSHKVIEPTLKVVRFDHTIGHEGFLFIGLLLPLCEAQRSGVRHCAA
jgi:hypothetical protein